MPTIDVNSKQGKKPDPISAKQLRVEEEEWKLKSGERSDNIGLEIAKRALVRETFTGPFTKEYAEEFKDYNSSRTTKGAVKSAGIASAFLFGAMAGGITLLELAMHTAVDPVYNLAIGGYWALLPFSSPAVRVQINKAQRWWHARKRERGEYAAQAK